MRWTGYLLAGAALAVVLPVHAAPDITKRFNRLDANRDGKVTWAEAYPVRARQFLAMDRNQDGIVETNEFGGRALPLSAFDANGDGKLELSEFVGQHRRMFRKFDTNRDGTIERDEFAAAQQAVGGQVGRGRQTLNAWTSANM